MGMQDIDEHRTWMERTKRSKAGLVPRCVSCGCAGNCECGHRPLMEPEHFCELDINDEGESHRCYCCRAVEEAGADTPR